jgi:hypothetical protein
MGKFTVTHEINCDLDTFWKVFFDQEFNNALYRNELQFPDFQITSQQETDASIVRKIAAQPKMEVPGALQKLIGSGFRYTEEGSFDKATKIWKWRLTPSTLADKLRTEGVVRVEKIGDTKVRRIADITMEAKIFGLGGLIESSTEKQLREGWDKSARFMNEYLKKPR